MTHFRGHRQIHGFQKEGFLRKQNNEFDNVPQSLGNVIKLIILYGFLIDNLFIHAFMDGWMDGCMGDCDLTCKWQ